MSVSIDLYVGPKKGPALTRERFEALICDLIARRIVARPCALVAAPELPQDPVTITLALEKSKKDRGRLQILYRGMSSKELRGALAEAPFGEQDLCVWFEALDWSNEEISEPFEGEGWSNGSVLVFALAEKRAIEVEEDVLRFQHFLVISGENAPVDVAGTVIEEVLVRHLGPELATACSAL